MTAALRRLGFDRVFDTSFSADLTIMEEASELVQRPHLGGHACRC
ncbi:MAG: [Fe-Fe] hydrogenase large subunit C-terminal domain-containing protein [Thermoanaerobaculaceae bacterium]